MCLMVEIIQNADTGRTCLICAARAPPDDHVRFGPDGGGEHVSTLRAPALPAYGRHDIPGAAGAQGGAAPQCTRRQGQVGLICDERLGL